MRIALIMLWLGFFIGCNPQVKSSYSGIGKDLGDLALANIPQDHPGKLLMENNCYLCHNPKTSEESIIAPPMIVVKDSYMTKDINKEEFIDNMVSFIKNPTEETSKMPNAIEEFGLMPYQFYPENTLRQIADYMFDSEIEVAEWLKRNKD